ncbi:hypothetical protein BH10ACT10_BH10ACT10_13690 [soil metagenome]
MPDLASVRGSAVARNIGLAGIAGTVLLFAATILGSPGEPPLEATSAEAARYIAGLDVSWKPAVAAVADLAMMILLWFMVGLGLLLRRVEGEIPIRSTMAMLSGVLVAAYVVLDPTEEAATHRVAELSQAQLAFAYDVTSIGFSKVWLATGTFALACGWVVVSTAFLPRWLGWWGITSGIALGLTQFVWTREGVWFAPYAAFWLWLLTTCVLLVRRPPQDLR